MPGQSLPALVPAVAEKVHLLQGAGRVVSQDPGGYDGEAEDSEIEPLDMVSLHSYGLPVAAEQEQLLHLVI